MRRLADPGASGQPEPGRVAGGDAGHVPASQRPGTAGASAMSVSGASCEERFFAIPFDEIAGFEEVAERARSLATLPQGLDLDHFANADEKSTIARNRKRLLRPPDVERMSFLERRLHADKQLKRRVERARRTRGLPARRTPEHGWRIGPVNLVHVHPSPRIQPLRDSVDRFFSCKCPCLGDQLYPPGAFRGWHSNRYNYIGWVVFLVEVAEPGRSSFRYLDPRTGDMVVVPDRNDVAYFFRTSSGEPLFWHGVLCERTFRWSQGFALPDDWKQRVVRVRRAAGDHAPSVANPDRARRGGARE